MQTYDLDTTTFDLEGVDRLFAGESVEFRFQVLVDGDPKDITEDDLAFRVFERQYASSEEVLSDDDDGVSILDSEPQADPENGEWEVRIDADATEDLWGEYFARPEVSPPSSDPTVAEWRIRVLWDA